MDRSRVALICALIALVVIVVGAGVYRNDLNYTSTGAALIAALTFLYGRNNDQDDS